MWGLDDGIHQSMNHEISDVRMPWGVGPETRSIGSMDQRISTHRGYIMIQGIQGMQGIIGYPLSGDNP